MAEQGARSVNLVELQEAQEVLGSDGQRIGGVAGISLDADTNEPYLEVSAGLMKMLYVPQHAVAYAVLGEPVRLAVPAEIALQRFDVKPNVL